jgi:thiamine kinase-like enzyme
MSKNRTKSHSKRKRRYIFKDSTDPYKKVYLVYYYNTENVILMTDGPFEDEVSAQKKMKSLLLKEFCAWIVSYND